MRITDYSARLKHGLSYLITAQSGKFLHSPSVFEFYYKVLHASTEPSLLSSLKDYRSRLKNESATWQKIENGAGSMVLHKRKSVKAESRYSGVPLKHSLLLARICAFYGYKDVLELGTSMGISTLAMALGNESNAVTSIEGCSNTYAARQEQWNKHIPKEIANRVHFVNSDFQAFWNSCSEDYDLIFIDGDHTYQAVIENTKKALGHVRPGGLIILDDINWSQGMVAAWKELTRWSEITCSINLNRMGILSFRQQAKSDFKLWF